MQYYTIALIVVCAILAPYVDATGNGMFCKPVEEDSQFPNEGNCEQEKVNATVKQQADSVVSLIITKMEEMEERLLLKLNTLKASLQIVKKEIQSEICGGIHYSGRCYWAVVTDKEVTDYSEAVDICDKRSGQPADILDAKHYNMTMNYLRSLISVADSYIWLGMNIAKSSSYARMSNGKRATFVNYQESYPAVTRVKTQMALEVDLQPSSEEGMWNTRGTDALHGVLCQK